MCVYVCATYSVRVWLVNNCLHFNILMKFKQNQTLFLHPHPLFLFIAITLLIVPLLIILILLHLTPATHHYPPLPPIIKDTSMY